MPIIHMADNDAETFPDGAYCPLDHREQNLWWVLVLYTTHHGLCLFEREMNGYDDSDFYMTVWNPETKNTSEIMFATTRGWTYPCMASRADATPEVRAEYDAYIAAAQRRNNIMARWNQRKKIRAFSAKYNIPTFAVKRIMNFAESYRDACFGLLKTKKFRSGFRESLNKRLREWCAEQTPKYSTPFSPKQAQYLY